MSLRCPLTRLKPSVRAGSLRLWARDRAGHLLRMGLFRGMARAPREYYKATANVNQNQQNCPNRRGRPVGLENTLRLKHYALLLPDSDRVRYE